MSKNVRLVFDRRKQVSDTVPAAIEIVVCLQRQRFYFSIGKFVFSNQWKDGLVVNHPTALLINEKIKKKVTEYEHILIAMEVNKDEMTIVQFKTYIGTEGGNRHNFMAWMRERIENRTLSVGTRKGHFTMYHSMERFGKIKIFDDITL